MPGIVGVIRKSSGADPSAQVRVMTQRMCHESFHKAGGWSDATGGIALGWVTEEGTFSDCLPVWNERRDVLLLFSGEHFGEHESVVAQLRAKGHDAGPADASGVP